MSDVELSDADVQILGYLQEDPRISMAALAEKTNSTISPCWRRVRRLEETGVIEGYSLRLNRKALGLGIEAFVFVKIASHREEEALEFERALTGIEEVLSRYILSGAEDYLLRVVARDIDSFASLNRRVLASLPFVREVRRAFVMHSIKESHRVPLPGRI